MFKWFFISFTIAMYFIFYYFIPEKTKEIEFVTQQEINDTSRNIISMAQENFKGMIFSKNNITQTTKVNTQLENHKNVQIEKNLDDLKQDSKTKFNKIEGVLLKKDSKDKTIRESAKNNVNLWFTPSKKICLRHKGRIQKGRYRYNGEYSCLSSWENALKICSESKARLAKKKEFEQVISECQEGDNQEAFECYNKKGFLMLHYRSAYFSSSLVKDEECDLYQRLREIETLEDMEKTWCRAYTLHNYRKKIIATANIESKQNIICIRE